MWLVEPREASEVLSRGVGVTKAAFWGDWGTPAARKAEERLPGQDGMARNPQSGQNCM